MKFRFESRIPEALVKMRAGAVVGLGMAAEMLLEISNRTVPIEEATLLRSGTTQVDAMNLEAAVGYDTPYAARQHEELSYRHDPGRRAKWLELTLQEQSETLIGVIGAGISGSLR